MYRSIALIVFWGAVLIDSVSADDFKVDEDGAEIRIETPLLKATVRKKGYVSGVAAQSLIDKTTGARDAGFGLDIVDWIMEPGSDETYRNQLERELVYEFGNAWHGRTPKRSIEGPQICTQAKELHPQITLGTDCIVIDQSFTYRTAAPGKKTGSTWSQRLVFPRNTRYFISMDRIDAVNSSEAMFLRVDMPGHIKHNQGDSFSQVYLSYRADESIPASEFVTNFAPDEKFNYERERDGVPERFIRAYQLKNATSTGPWLAGMTLDPSMPCEAWCHQRGYVCMIEEFGGRPIKAGESFSAAFIIGYFDSIDEMNAVYDKYKGATKLDFDTKNWSLK